MSKAPQHVVFLNFGGIGDQILFSPVLSAVRHALPDSKLTLFIEDRSMAVADLLPQIDQAIPVQVQGVPRSQLFWTLLKQLWQQRPQAIISSGTTPFISLLLWLTDAPIRVGYNSHFVTQLLLSHMAPLALGVYAGQLYFALATTFLSAIKRPLPALKTIIPELSVDAQYPQQITTKLNELTHRQNGPHPGAPTTFKRRIVIHPGVSQVSINKGILKAWSPHRWAELIQKLIAHDPELQIIIAGGPDDHTAVSEIDQLLKAHLGPYHPQLLNFYGQTKSLNDLAGLLTVVDMLISVDSGPMHIAIGLKRPVVALFSPTCPSKLVPNVPWVKTVVKPDLPCRPCLFDVRQTSCSTPTCLDIEVQAVFEASLSLLSQLEAVR